MFDKILTIVAILIGGTYAYLIDEGNRGIAQTPSNYIILIVFGFATGIFMRKAFKGKSDDDNNDDLHHS